MSRRTYKKYSDAEKAAYYKKLAMANASPSYGPAPPRKRKPATRKRAVARTRKDNYTDGAIGAGVGTAIGGAIGGLPGAALGGAIGRGAHQLFKAITGFGDYNVHENTLMLGGMTPPQIVNSSNTGGFIVRHREYIGDISATVNFTIAGYPINPGLPGSFPWLSQIAPSFEEYRMRGLVYEFKSLSSDAVLSSATSSALGSVIMATDYNVLGPLFANKMQMENYEFANSSKPSCSFYHPVECKKSVTSVSELYIRNESVPPNADQRLYDMGLFQIATVGMQAASGVAGELWCTYEVELYHPKFNAQVSDGLTDHWNLQGPIDASHPLGTTGPILSVGGSLGTTVDILSQVVFFPVGLLGGTKILMEYNIVSGTPYTFTRPTITPQGLTLMNAFNGGTYSIISAPQNGCTGTKNINITAVWIVDSTITVAESVFLSFGTATGTVFGDGSAYQDLIFTVIDPDFSANIV